MRNRQGEGASTGSSKTHLGRGGVSGIKAEEEPGKLLKKRNSKCYLCMNNLKEISSEHKRKIQFDRRSHSRG